MTEATTLMMPSKQIASKFRNSISKHRSTYGYYTLSVCLPFFMYSRSLTEIQKNAAIFLPQTSDNVQSHIITAYSMGLGVGIPICMMSKYDKFRKSSLTSLLL